MHYGWDNLQIRLQKMTPMMVWTCSSNDRYTKKIYIEIGKQRVNEEEGNVDNIAWMKLRGGHDGKRFNGR